MHICSLENTFRIQQGYIYKTGTVQYSGILIGYVNWENRKKHHLFVQLIYSERIYRSFVSFSVITQNVFGKSSENKLNGANKYWEIRSYIIQISYLMDMQQFRFLDNLIHNLSLVPAEKMCAMNTYLFYVYIKPHTKTLIRLKL